MVRLVFPLLLGVLLAFAPVFAQTSVRVLVTDEHEGTPLPGATVVLDGTTFGAATDSDGIATLAGVPDGAYVLAVSFVAYEAATRDLVLPLADPAALVEVELEEGHDEMGEVVVGATRTSRTIAEIPTRVEVIAGEEIDEKISMEPSNITMLLNESPGIVVQQTSAVSANASIRIQGLDGRYTQLLKDGFPLYGGFSGGLALLQVPPLDLKQVEVIKGPASTLYGGDAIAGLVNLGSKTPGATADAAPERSLLLNATSAGGVDVGGFFADRSQRFGYTLLASANLQRAYDGDDDAFTNLPQTRRYTLAPRGYWYPSERTTVWLGLTGTIEEREGGDVDVIDDDAAFGFVERNESRRLTSQARLDHAFSEWTTLTLKQSTSLFDRTLDSPRNQFQGTQTATYSEASTLLRLGRHDLVAGLDLRTDAFDQREGLGFGDLDYSHASFGAFVQDSWNATDRFALELGLRGEVHNEYGAFALPRASALYRITEGLSARLTGGLGYKAPTAFLEPSEERAFAWITPLRDDLDAETSAGGTFDVNYNGVLFDRVTLSFNQAVFATRLDNALVGDVLIAPDPSPTPDFLAYRNASGPVQTRGLETNARFGLDDFKLFLGYVYVDATIRDAFPGQLEEERERTFPLTPAHKTYTVLVWEQHGRGRIGLEAYYTGPQRLSDGERVPGFWVGGVMGEWRVGPARLFLNFENVLETQQTNYDPVVLGPRATPEFAEIWAPTDGFIVNGGVKYDL